MKKKELLAAAAVLETANDALLGGKHKDLQGLTEMLVQCQDVAIQIGNSLEERGSNMPLLCICWKITARISTG